MKKTTTGLSPLEKRVVKSLLAQGMRSQDVHARISHNRSASINFSRISAVKKDTAITEATPEELSFFSKKQASFNPITGLNLYDNERLIRAREAMILAVTTFNNATSYFKTEVFAVLANIAWTYLLHDFYCNKGTEILNKDGTTWALSHMLSRGDCPLSKGIKNNLNALKAIRDQVEHQLLGRSDLNWLPLFQACCLNFDKTIVELFGAKASLQNELSIALQFGKLTVEQAAQVQMYDIPGYVTALDAHIKSGMTEEELNDLEYQFRVVYTLESASKGTSHIQFLHPDSEEGKSVHNVLQKFKIADEIYPYKPGEVAKEVAKLSKMPFRLSDHTAAWKSHKVRPNAGSKNPDKTDRRYCIYHSAHRDYTYSQRWVQMLAAELQEAARLGVAKVSATSAAVAAEAPAPPAV